MSRRENCKLDRDYVRISSSTFKVCASFEFSGTSIEIPSKFSVVMSRFGTSGTVYVRLYDITNSKKITQLSFSQKNKSNHYSTVFNNLPTNSAIFELQIRRTGSSAKLHTMRLE